MSKISTSERNVFLAGMDKMMTVKKNIIALRDIKHKSQEIIQANPEDEDELSKFYGLEIQKAQQVIAASKAEAKSFIEQHQAQYPKTTAIFQSEYDDLPVM